MLVRFLQQGAGTRAPMAVAAPGYGFQLRPSGDQPGAFPVTVRLDQDPATDHKVWDGRPQLHAEAFRSLELVGLASGDGFTVQIFETRQEGVGAP